MQEAECDEKRIASLPDEEERRRQAYVMHRVFFGRWDAVLDCADYGPTWLSKPRVAEIVADGLHFRERQQYDLLAFCIMPNHVHVVLTPLPDRDSHYPSLTTIMQLIKGYTAREGNRLLGRHGQFWQHESHDHWVRDGDELQRVCMYVINNPVKAGMVDDWSDWPWTYCKHPPLA